MEMTSKLPYEATFTHFRNSRHPEPKVLIAKIFDEKKMTRNNFCNIDLKSPQFSKNLNTDRKISKIAQNI